MSQIVTCYGIHRTPTGVAYLQQGRSGTNAIGLREKSPFIVKLPTGKVHCNHQIPLSVPVPHDHHWTTFMDLLHDPLVQAMIPLPKEDLGVYWLSAEDERYTLSLVMLSRMSSPIYPCVVQAWMMKKEKLLDELYQTNVQPLVITGLEAKHSALVKELADTAVVAPRKLILVGQPDVVVPKHVKKLETGIRHQPIDKLSGLPWEVLGATLIRKYMRGEWGNPEGSYDHTNVARGSGR